MRKTELKQIQDPQQLRFLSELQTAHNLKEIKLSKRQSFVLEKVLRTKEYHSNYQYHLNVMRNQYEYLMDKID